MTITSVTTPAGNGIIQVRLSGRLSLASAIEVRRILRKCMAEQPVAVIVDIAALSVESPVLLTVFPAAAAAQPPPYVAVVLVSAAPALRTLMRGWILRSTAVCDTREQAVALLVDGGADRICRVDLAAGLTAPARARAVATRYCDEHSLSEVADSVVLVISELVSNAVRHARGAPRIRLAVRDPYLYVSVGDDSRRLPVLADVDHLSAVPLPRSGRGLHLVDMHSSAWGSIPFPDGKAVWAAIRIVPVNDPAAPAVP